jgi:23S rRNA maturation mini-RNase III
LVNLLKKSIVKVVPSQQQKQILNTVCEKLGQSENETLRIAFRAYAKEINLITEKVHT